MYKIRIKVELVNNKYKQFEIVLLDHGVGVKL